MNAPFLWIVLPLAVAGFTLLLRTERAILIFGVVTSLFLVLFALLVPIDVALLIGPVSFKLEGSLNILGRSFNFTEPDGTLLAIVYGLAAIWFLVAETLNLTRRLVPIGLAIIALLVASTAVQPFLFAALLIEVAILLAIPMLLPLSQTPGRGITRFLIYQTLAMPFILFAGWLLSGVETSPGDITLTSQASAMLIIGFAFLLAVFPLYTWIPALMEEVNAYLAAFLLWILPQTTLLFLISFIDRYIFLRGSPELLALITAMGLIMVVSAGIWAAFQTHLGRMMGYFVVAETGFLLIALGLGTVSGTQAIFLQLIPRGMIMILWALCLSIIESQVESPRFSLVQGAMRVVPFAAIGLVIASLASAGFPLLAQFPSLLLVMEGLASISLGQLFLLLLGVLGLLTGAIRMLAVFVMAPVDVPWESRENRVQAVMILFGIAMIFLMGIFPQVTQPLLEKLPSLFPFLGQ